MSGSGKRKTVVFRPGRKTGRDVFVKRFGESGFSKAYSVNSMRAINIVLHYQVTSTVVGEDLTRSGHELYDEF